MAFNPFQTFQRNRRFWMAAILMVCMFTFVFCTGMKGDMAERFQWMFGSKGATAFTMDGRNYTIQQLNDLRTQRNLANKLMLNCADMSFKKLSKDFFELGKKQDAKGKDAENREQSLIQIAIMRDTIAQRKSRQRYFDVGVKFDDLVEFTMWQAVADRLGIRLEKDDIDRLYFMEFFYQLDGRALDMAERETLKEFRDVSHSYVHHAIAEEFRVRMAQEAVMIAQPFQFLGRKRGFDGQTLNPKFINADIPNEIRVPMTLGQLWDSYKKSRSEFDVTLLPINVQEFLTNVKTEPNEIEKAEYYKAHKDKPNDPSADVRGLQLLPRAKFEYVLADPESPAYLESAKLVDQLRVMTPFAPEANVAPLAALTRYWMQDMLHSAELQFQYENVGRNDQANYWAAPFSERDCVSPILARFASKHPQAAVSIIGSSLSLSPLDPLGALTGYLAWGAVKHPEQVDLAVKAELKRRAPFYAAAFAATTSPFPLENLAPFAPLWFFHPPKLPLEVVKTELEDMLARRAAEEKAQQNMLKVRTALEKASDDGEKFKRELNKLVPEFHLTYGPPADKKNVYFDRYTVNQAKELEPLREAYLKYVDMINFFEGRDVTPEKLLKPGDFYKMLFDSNETFLAGAPYRAMAWPPSVRPNSARIWKEADPRLVDHRNMDKQQVAGFLQSLKEQNPLQPLPVFDDLYKNAAKPILYWRTTKRDPVALPNDYADIAKKIKKIDSDSVALEHNLKKFSGVEPKVDALRKQLVELQNANKPKEVERILKELAPLNEEVRKIETEVGGSPTVLRRRLADLKEDETDLKETQRLVVEGWKFDRARSSEALPTAKTIAETLIKNGNQGVHAQAAKLNATPFSLSHLSRMYPERMADNSRDYGKPPLPKENLKFPRDNMVDEAISLYDLSDPIKTGNKEIDDVNKALFERVRKQPNARGNYVQILTNKPRSVFYVAFVSMPPDARRDDFINSLRGAYPFDDVPMRFSLRDRFAERAQQQEAASYRPRLIASLQRTLKYSLDDEKARSNFDERTVGD